MRSQVLAGLAVAMTAVAAAACSQPHSVVSDDLPYLATVRPATPDLSDDTRLNLRDTVCTQLRKHPTRAGYETELDNLTNVLGGDDSAAYAAGTIIGAAAVTACPDVKSALPTSR